MGITARGKTTIAFQPANTNAWVIPPGAKMALICGAGVASAGDAGVGHWAWQPSGPWHDAPMPGSVILVQVPRRLRNRRKPDALYTELTGTADTNVQWFYEEEDGAAGVIASGTYGQPYVQGQQQIGASFVGSNFPVLAGALDTTGLVSQLRVDANGQLAIGSGTLPTYRVVFHSPALAANPTDVWALIGPTTGVCRLMRLRLIASANVTGYLQRFGLFKRSTLDTGGTTAGGGNIVPLSSADGAPTESTLAWTANPTGLGTLVGEVHSEQFPVQVNNSTVGQAQWDLSFGLWGSKAPELRSSSECLVLNLGGNAVPANFAFDLMVEFVHLAHS